MYYPPPFASALPAACFRKPAFAEQPHSHTKQLRVTTPEEPSLQYQCFSSFSLSSFQTIFFNDTLQYQPPHFCGHMLSSTETNKTETRCVLTTPWIPDPIIHSHFPNILPREFIATQIFALNNSRHLTNNIFLQSLTTKQITSMPYLKFKYAYFTKYPMGLTREFFLIYYFFLLFNKPILY